MSRRVLTVSLLSFLVNSGKKILKKDIINVNKRGKYYSFPL